MSDRNFKHFWCFVAEIVDNDEFMDTLDDIHNDTGMLKAIKGVFNWTPPPLSNCNSFKKSSIKSMEYAEEAIKAANNEEEARSLKLANMITAFAQDDGDIALGHLIRFLLIDLFKMYKYPEKEELELYLKCSRQAKTMKANIRLIADDGTSFSPNQGMKNLTQFLKNIRVIEESSEFKESVAEAEKGKEKKAKFTRDVHTLKSPNPKAPALEDFVEIKYNSVKGRHLVVTKDVPAGTTLIIEQPVVAGLGNVLDLEISRCHQCFKDKFTPIPCPNCVFVLYCSEKCLEESKEYHSKYECAVYPHLYSILSPVEDNYNFLCAYSAVCTFGPHEVFRTFQKQQQEELQPKKSESKEEGDGDDFIIPGVDPETGIYDSSSFYTINYASKIKERPSTEQVLIALALTKTLETRTNFFEQLESKLSKSKKVKSLFRDFITLSMISIYNSHFVNKSKEPDYFDAPSRFIVYAFSIQATHKLSNHSCYGNIAVGDSNNLKGLGTVALSLKDLKEGEEVCRSYGVSFIDEKKDVRQSKLLEDYGFVCDCVACVNDWPLLRKLEARKDRPKFCCPLCSHKIPPQPEMLTKENFEKIALNSGNNFICPQCKTEYKEKELMSQFKRNVMALEIAEKLIQEGTGQETLKSLKAASTFFQNHLILPSYYQIKCAELVPRAINNSLMDVYDS